jgi:arylsulfatase
MDDFIAQTAVDYIERSDRSQPLHLFVGLGGPHNPWDPPVRFDTYRSEDMPAPLPRDPAPDWLTGPALRHHEKLMGGNAAVTSEDWLRLRALYSGRVEHVDHCLGQVMEAWSAARGRDTWVLFWTDHGAMIGDKERVLKEVFYRASVRVPAIVRPPEPQSRQIVCDGLCTTTDLTATVLDMAGCGDPGPNVFGRSLLPALEGHERAGSPVAVSENYDRTMIFDGRWKMVVNSNSDLLKLFDTLEDPNETINLVGHPDVEGVIAHLRGELLNFLLRTSDCQYSGEEQNSLDRH